MLKHQFVSIKKRTEAELYEQESGTEAWAINALRARIGIDNDPQSTDRGDLLSLKDIMLFKAENKEDKIQEAYIMLDDDLGDKEGPDSIKHDQTMIVKRTNLLFNNKECVVLNFEDISAVKRLKLEEEKTRVMSALYSSVHHEMIGPLKSNEEAAVRLIRSLTDNKLRQ